MPQEVSNGLIIALQLECQEMDWFQGGNQLFRSGPIQVDQLELLELVPLLQQIGHLQ